MNLYEIESLQSIYDNKFEILYIKSCTKKLNENEINYINDVGHMGVTSNSNYGAFKYIIDLNYKNIHSYLSYAQLYKSAIVKLREDKLKILL